MIGVESMQVVVFTIGDRLYGILSDEVIEITEPVEWTDIPQSPEWMIGLINLRGNVLSLINFDKFLNKGSQSEEVCYNSTIIVKRDKGNVAFATGTVTQVVDVDETALQLTDDKEKDAVKGYFSQDDSIVNLIDLQTLFLKE